MPPVLITAVISKHLCRVFTPKTWKVTESNAHMGCVSFTLANEPFTSMHIFTIAMIVPSHRYYIFGLCLHLTLSQLIAFKFQCERSSVKRSLRVFLRPAT